MVYPDPAHHPLRDPRVQVHIEDGRFFLQTTERHFDLITGEPPPPRYAGIGISIRAEYFQLVRAALRDDGVVTYWLPTTSSAWTKPERFYALLRRVSGVLALDRVPSRLDDGRREEPQRTGVGRGLRPAVARPARARELVSVASRPPSPSAPAHRDGDRQASGLCVACGYDMHGLEFNERCPECGTLVY